MVFYCKFDLSLNRAIIKNIENMRYLLVFIGTRTYWRRDNTRDLFCRVNFTSGESIIFNRFTLHLDGITSSKRSSVSTVFHDNRVQKVFMQMIHIFQGTTLCSTSDTNVINERKMLDILTQANAT